MDDQVSQTTRTRTDLMRTVREGVRDLIVEVTVLNSQVGSRLELRDLDLNCLNLIQRRGPLQPATIARLTGVHPATLTGILDRLERAGWVARERTGTDRRAVTVRALPTRAADIRRLYAGMNQGINNLCRDFSDDDLRTLARFLQGAASAGHSAAQDLHPDDHRGSKSMALGRR